MAKFIRVPQTDDIAKPAEIPFIVLKSSNFSELRAESELNWVPTYIAKKTESIPWAKKKRR